MLKENIITVDVGASKIRIQTIDKDGQLKSDSIISLVGLNFNNKTFLELLINNIKSVINTDKDSNILGISVGVPGLVDSDSKIIKIMPNIKNVRDLDIEQGLGDIFNMPIFLLNDADAGVLGEYWLGADKKSANIIYLTISTGLGSGVIVNHKLQPGSELGHKISINNNEQRTCMCGRLNCAEAYIGTRGLSRVYSEIFNLDPESLSITEQYSISPEMKDGVASGNQKWIEVQYKYISYVSNFLKNIILSYSPEVIILGGGIIYNNYSLFIKLKEGVGDVGKKTEIKISTLENSVNLGLAKYAFNLLDDIR